MFLFIILLSKRRASGSSNEGDRVTFTLEDDRQGWCKQAGQIRSLTGFLRIAPAAWRRAPTRRAFQRANHMRRPRVAPAASIGRVRSEGSPRDFPRSFAAIAIRATGTGLVEAGNGSWHPRRRRTQHLRARRNDARSDRTSHRCHARARRPSPGDGASSACPAQAHRCRLTGGPASLCSDRIFAGLA